MELFLRNAIAGSFIVQTSIPIDDAIKRAHAVREEFLQNNKFSKTKKHRNWCFLIYGRVFIMVERVIAHLVRIT